MNLPKGAKKLIKLRDVIFAKVAGNDGAAVVYDNATETFVPETDQYLRSSGETVGGTAETQVFDNSVHVSTSGDNLKGLIIGTGDTITDAQTRLQITGVNVSIFQKIIRAAGGGFANSINKFTARNLTSDIESQIVDIGAYGNIGTDPVAPTLNWFYISTLLSGSYINANLFLTNLGRMGVGINNNTPTATLDVTASKAEEASLRLRDGVAPTSANKGDVWLDSEGFAFQEDAKLRRFDEYINYVDSTSGGNLIVNGTGLYGDNTNFANFEFDPTVANGTGGSFKHSGTYVAKRSDSLFPILPSALYKLSCDVKYEDVPLAGKRQYVGLSFYDIDKIPLSTGHSRFENGTLSTLTRDFNVSVDTKIYLDNVTGWNIGATDNGSGIIVWDYTNAFGFTYPPNTYSRKWLRGAIVASSTATDEGGGEWSFPARTPPGSFSGLNNSSVITAGTQISHYKPGGNFNYCTMSNETVPDDGTWHSYTGYIGGTDPTGGYATRAIPQGTAYCSLVILPNYNGVSTTDTKVWFTNFDMRVIPTAEFISTASAATTGPLGTIPYDRAYIAKPSSTGVTSVVVT